MIVNGVQGVVMEKVFSQKDGSICHMCFSLDSAPLGRTDLVDADEGLQIACLNLHEDKKFKAHKHLPRPRTIGITQEAWIVVSGKVKVIYYDVDGTHLGEAILKDGDITMTFRGGHGYEIIEAAEIFEVKLGPFSAVDDKEYLG